MTGVLFKRENVDNTHIYIERMPRETEGRG